MSRTLLVCIVHRYILISIHEILTIIQIISLIFNDLLQVVVVLVGKHQNNFFMGAKHVL